jgi:hypothetical protein
MNKTIQSIILTIVISIGIAARLSILGWLYFIGIGTSILFGTSHLIIHLKSMNYLALKGRYNLLKLLLSHFFFLTIFFFQIDADDSKIYSITEYILGRENDFISEHGMLLVGISIVAYIVISVFIIKAAKKEKLKSDNQKYFFPVIVASVILPFMLIKGLDNLKDFQRNREYEKIGVFSSVKRALKNPEEVTTFKINPYEKNIFKIPIEILNLPNLRVIELDNQNITVIPVEIENAQNLEILNLIGNNIKEIPSSICNCKKLTEIRIGGEIKSIPDCLKKMSSLKHLSIQSNTANELMDELREFEYLETSHFYLKNGILNKEKLNQIRKETGIKHKY